MATDFYEKAGKLISPGDIFDELPYVRTTHPTRVARKVAGSPPKRWGIQGELRQILEVGKHNPIPSFDFAGHGEEIISNARVSRAMFLTWGSEVEADEKSGNLHKKDWLIAPIFSLKGLDKDVIDDRTGAKLNLAEAVKAGKSPRYFPLNPFPGESGEEFYVDFKRITPLAANHFQSIPRRWHLTRPALNDLYHQLLWFFTRKQIFFRPVECQKCGAPVDLGVVFEGQAINEDEPDPN